MRKLIESHQAFAEGEILGLIEQGVRYHTAHIINLVLHPWRLEIAASIETPVQGKITSACVAVKATQTRVIVGLLMDLAEAADNFERRPFGGIKR